MRLNAKCISLLKADNGVIVGLDCTDENRQVQGSHLLLAVGRVPNTDDLGLDKAGVETDKSGYIKVDDQLRTNVAGIWALGDCNGKGAFTHTAYNDFEIVAANLLDNDPILGVTGDEVIHSLLDVMYAKAPYTTIRRAMHIHPTVSELLPTLLQELQPLV